MEVRCLVCEMVTRGNGRGIKDSVMEKQLILLELFSLLNDEVFSLRKTSNQLLDRIDWYARNQTPDSKKGRREKSFTYSEHTYHG